MTLVELNRYYELVKDLEKTKELLYNLRSAACPGAQVLTGMPHAPGVRDKIGDFAVEIADTQTRVDYITKEIAEHKVQVTAFVDSIDDGYLHTIFQLRFLKGYAWKDVANIVGGGNTEASVKSACYRYLKICNAMTRRDT